MNRRRLAFWLGAACTSVVIGAIGSLWLLATVTKVAETVNGDIDRCDDQTSGTYIINPVERAEACGQ